MSITELEPGEVVAGRWRVDRTIGSGGAGIVYACRDTETGQAVAIKCLQMEDDPAVGLARFEREAAIGPMLESPHAVRVQGSGTWRGIAFFVMDLLSGTPLSRVAQLRGRVPSPDVVDWFVQACDAIGEAHRKGIVHRDVKLANLFWARTHDSYQIKVLDFGLAKLRTYRLGAHEKSITPLTMMSTVMGTPRFMAPEQWRSAREADPRSDIWGLGVCLYRLVTGTYPFEGESAGALCFNITRGFLRPPRYYDPSVPQSVERVILRCLAYSPKQRFSDATTLKDALEDARDREVASTRPRPPQAATEPTSVTRLHPCMAEG